MYLYNYTSLKLTTTNTTTQYNLLYFTECDCSCTLERQVPMDNVHSKLCQAPYQNKFFLKKIGIFSIFPERKQIRRNTICGQKTVAIFVKKSICTYLTFKSLIYVSRKLDIFFWQEVVYISTLSDSHGM